jgi:hypothetical protein
MIRVIQKAEQEGENTPVQVSVVDGNLNVKNLYKDGTVDAFGRQRVSEQYTLADYTHIYGEETELLTKTSGAQSNIAFDIKQAKAVLTVGTGANDYVIHQSRMYHHYMAGKSQLVLESFNSHPPRSGTNKMIGLYDDYNGIFFQHSGDGSLAIVLRSDVSGSVQDTIIPQSAWNKDRCDGTGPSAFNLDISKTQLFTADYQWLGVGRVRAGFVHDGNVIIAHEFYNSNNKETVYWSNPNLPIRCEIRNYSNGMTGTSSMDQICATVVSEGGYSEAGVDFAARNTGYRNITAGSTMPVMAIRLKTGYFGVPNRSIVRLGGSQIYSADQLCSYEFWRLPSGTSLIGGSWQSVDSSSVVEYNITATGFNLNGGNLFSAGFVPVNAVGVGNTAGVSSSLANVSSAKRNYISQNIDSNDSNIFAILLKNTAGGPGNTTNVLTSIQWRETR